jgi:hypothetical protein
LPAAALNEPDQSQEHETENALAALRDLSSPRALVVRDARQIRIAGRDVVRGDVIQAFGAPWMTARATPEHELRSAAGKEPALMEEDEADPEPGMHPLSRW